MKARRYQQLNPVALATFETTDVSNGANITDISTEYGTPRSFIDESLRAGLDVIK
jgi:hypothetical protein